MQCGGTATPDSENKFASSQDCYGTPSAFRVCDAACLWVQKPPDWSAEPRRVGEQQMMMGGMGGPGMGRMGGPMMGGPPMGPGMGGPGMGPPMMGGPGMGPPMMGGPPGAPMMGGGGGGGGAGGGGEERGGAFYKTRMCHAWQAGRCKYGETCKYAHGEADVQRAPPGASRPPWSDGLPGDRGP